ncbi:hypothetical protein B566_EDAN002860 [Ephemera danica]|nr:hypothetical protein B566_EDAN002860 [Ephemera danica]
MSKFHLICLISLGLCFLLTVESAVKGGSKVEEEDEEEDEEEPATQKPAVVVKPVVPQNQPPPSGDTASDTELTRALDNVGQVIDAIVKEGQSDLTYDPNKADSDLDTDDVIAAKLTRITQDLIKVFSDTNQVPDDASDGVDDSVKLEKTVQEILTAFGDSGGNGKPESGDVAENLLSTVEEILKFYNEETAGARLSGKATTPEDEDEEDE